MGTFLKAQRAVNSAVCDRIVPNFELVRDIMVVLHTCHVEQSSFIQIVDMNRFFTGNPVSVRLIDYRKKS